MKFEISIDENFHKLTKKTQEMVRSELIGSLTNGSIGDEGDEEASGDSLDVGPGDALDKYECLDVNFPKYLSSDVCTGRAKKCQYMEALKKVLDEDKCFTIRAWVLEVGAKNSASTYRLIRRIIFECPKAFRKI